MLRTDNKIHNQQRTNQYRKRLSSILRAASKVIAKDGFEGASVREIATRAKIGLSGIYYYFESKDELLYALQQHTFSNLIIALNKKLELAVSPEDRLKAVVENHFNFFVNNMDDLKVCVHEMETLSGKYYKDILKIRQEYYRLVRDVIAEITDKSGYKTNLAALFLFGSLNWIYMWYDSEKNSDINKLSGQLIEVFLCGIKKS